MMKKNRPILRFLLLSGLAGLFSVVLGASSVYLYLSPSLPSVDSLKNIQLQTPLRIYTSDGKLMAEYGEKRRMPVTYEDVPQQFYNALIAAEDENFYSHIGIDFKGLARAAYELITTGKKRSGGSTITMQVAKNYYLSSEKTFTRKFTEILLALHIEQELNKKEILELYVNKIYLGKRAYGVESAAQVYYGKSIKELSLAQLAMIAGLPQAPSAANPINNPERAIYRRNYVLARMFTSGFITQEEFDEAGSEAISAKYHGLSTEIEAPYVAEMVRSEMLERFPDDLYTKGYIVTTTINSKLQVTAQSVIRKGLQDYDRKHGLRDQGNILPTYILPEQQQIPVSFSPTIWQLGDPAPSFDKTIDLPPSPADLNRHHWLQQIRNLNNPGDLEWAIVTHINEEDQSVRLATNGNPYITMPLEHYQWAKPYISVNELGKDITEAKQVLSIGQKVLVEKIEDDYWLAQTPEAQASLVSFDPQNGELKALVGGYDFSLSKYNRSIQADRQPGSSFKPFVYSAGLEYGLTPASIINDAPVVFDDDSLEAVWRPENYSGKFFGPTRLRQALYKSRNLVSIRMLRQTGIGRTIRYISNFGLPKEKLNRDLSLALGSSGLTPFEMASGYNALANGGYKVEPHFIRKIENDEGEVLFTHKTVIVCEPCLASIADFKQKLDEEYQLHLDEAALDDSISVIELNEAKQMQIEEFIQQFPPLAPRIMDARVNYLMYTMLQDVIKQGTGKRALALNRTDLAGKTGTTNDQKDAWFSGYNNKLVANVWVGFDSPQTLGKWAFGSNTALPIWVDYMRVALDGVPNSPLKQPDGLVSIRIDPETGNRAYPGQANAMFEIFREENVPKQMEQEPSISSPYSNNEEGNEDSFTPEQLF
ncbi:peptidoglycan glycosyltransferase/peptidoglycan DD-transpeptidase MrcA [Oceaniserpentilla sp. 4NH20-0058]